MAPAERDTQAAVCGVAQTMRRLGNVAVRHSPQVEIGVLRAGTNAFPSDGTLRL